MSISVLLRALTARLAPLNKEKRGARRSGLGMIFFIGILHVAGWMTLLAIVVPQHLSIGTKVFGFGVGVTAYVLGMRHAFDADHIAAIDNTTRRLMRSGKPPLSVGFWFSLGHSSVVFALTLLLALGVRAIAGPLTNDNSILHQITGLFGTLVSTGFLYIIAALNLIVLVEIWRLFRRMRAGTYDETALEMAAQNRGLMNRILRPVMELVRDPWQMYFIGFLFGLGFDTATEIALLVLTSSGAASGLPWYAVLCLPILFAAGMSLLDTIDGCFMTAAYGWALATPVRKIYYNLIVTGLSVAVAFIIGSIEIAALFGQSLKLRGAFWSWTENLDLNTIGFFVVGLFAATWLLAVVFWKFRGGEAPWAATAVCPSVVEPE